MDWHARFPCPSQSLPKFLSIKSVMLSNHLILCQPVLLLPSVFPSIRVFSNKLALCIRWSQYWSFSFSISPSHEYSGLLSFRIDWLDLLAGQRTLRLLQHHNLKVSVLHIRWPEYWSFSFSISPPSEYSGLLSFRIDWLDLLAVQGTLKSLFNTTIQKHQFFGTQLSL